MLSISYCLKNYYNRNKKVNLYLTAFVWSRHYAFPWSQSEEMGTKFTKSTAQCGQCRENFAFRNCNGYVSAMRVESDWISKAEHVWIVRFIHSSGCFIPSLRHNFISCAHYLASIAISFFIHRFLHLYL